VGVTGATEAAARAAAAAVAEAVVVAVWAGRLAAAAGVAAAGVVSASVPLSSPRGLGVPPHSPDVPLPHPAHRQQQLMELRRCCCALVTIFDSLGLFIAEKIIRYSYYQHGLEAIRPVVLTRFRFALFPTHILWELRIRHSKPGLVRVDSLRL